jgi:hypothetical protein
MKRKIFALAVLSASLFLVSQTCLNKHRLSNQKTQEISEHVLASSQDIEFQDVTKEEERRLHPVFEEAPVVLIIPPIRVHVSDHAEVHSFYIDAVSLVPARASPLFSATEPSLSC